MPWSIVGAIDGVHDMGGMQGFGAATWPGAEEPWHADWEIRAFALALVTGVERLRVNSSRADREEMAPADYLRAGYFERWVYSTERGVVENGVVATAEIDAMAARIAAGDAPHRTSDPDQAARLVAALRRAHPLPAPANPRFTPGSAVRVRRARPAGHNRSPRYLRGCAGTVDRVQPADRVPGGEVEAVYLVRFASHEVFGDDGERCTILADLFESYLEPH
jgi:nitrile hydratase subunit beta